MKTRTQNDNSLCGQNLQCLNYNKEGCLMYHTGVCDGIITWDNNQQVYFAGGEKNGRCYSSDILVVRVLGFKRARKQTKLLENIADKLGADFL